MYRPFQFQKHSQYFFGADDETLSVAMRVHNPDRSAFEIQSGYTAPTETGFAEIISDDFPILHKADSAILQQSGKSLT